jgi:hypothetical protein
MHSFILSSPLYITVPPISNSTFLCSIHHSAFQLSRVLCKSCVFNPLFSISSFLLYPTSVTFILHLLPAFSPSQSFAVCHPPLSFSVIRPVFVWYPSSFILYSIIFFHSLVHRFPFFFPFCYSLSAQTSSAENSRMKFMLRRIVGFPIYERMCTLKPSSWTYNFVEVSGA